MSADAVTGTDRRTALKKAAIAAGVVAWTTPAVQAVTSRPAHAQTVTGCKVEVIVTLKDTGKSCECVPAPPSCCNEATFFATARVFCGPLCGGDREITLNYGTLVKPGCGDPNAGRFLELKSGCGLPIPVQWNGDVRGRHQGLHQRSGTRGVHSLCRWIGRHDGLEHPRRTVARSAARDDPRDDDHRRLRRQRRPACRGVSTGE